MPPQGGGEQGGPPMGMVEEIAVELGGAVGAWQAIVGPLSSGDSVVVRGNENLRSGMPVIIAGEIEIEPPPAPDPDRPMAGHVGQGSAT